MKNATAFIVILGMCTGALFMAGCCKGCAEKTDLDVIPGMEDSGIPDVKAAKEHEEEIQQLNKDIEELTKELMEVTLDPNMSEAEKEKRVAEIEKEMEVKGKRLEEIAEDIANKDLK
ncbi:MAG: hypothetical protein PVH29_14370 [Candidatus Zixiibacteriota bacterium]